MAYSPTNMPMIRELEDLRKYVEDELNRIGKEELETTIIELRPIYVAPTKPREGMIVYADGTSWNPGSGKGVYHYTGSAWSKL